MLTIDRFSKAMKNCLKNLGLRISSINNNDIYVITDGFVTFTADMSPFREFYNGSDDNIIEYINRLRDLAIAENRLNSFNNGQEFLRLILINEDEVKSNYITADFVGCLKKAVVYTVDNKNYLFLDSNYIKRWNVPKEVAISAGERNLAKLMEQCEIQVDTVGDGILAGEFSGNFPEFTSSFILCSGFKQRMTDKVGDDFITVTPSPSALITLGNISENCYKDLGDAVINEYRLADRPLTTELFKYTNSGLTVMGRFTNE